ncbi:MAG: hypothetical protein HFJ75_03640 [Eggerthellaceae bacterium]|nr:hypothetical protein [Eggerthellaceae bacterium]
MFHERSHREGPHFSREFMGRPRGGMGGPGAGPGGCRGSGVPGGHQVTGAGGPGGWCGGGQQLGGHYGGGPVPGHFVGGPGRGNHFHADRTPPGPRSGVFTRVGDSGWIDPDGRYYSRVGNMILGPDGQTWTFLG